VAITVRKLGIPDTEMVESFHCGDLALDDYLRRYALKNQERHMVGMTYVAISSDTPDRVLGYYTIANTSIPRTRMPEDVLRGLPKYGDLPAILLGRFAVDADFQKRGIGHILMSHAISTSVAVSQLSAARYIFTESYDSTTGWYEKYSFRQIPGGEEPNRNKMYLDLKVVMKAREVAGKTLFTISA